MSRELTKEQKLAINALNKAIARIKKCNLVLCMQDGCGVIHHKSDRDNAIEFDCGCTGLKLPDGSYPEPVGHFSDVEH